MILINDREYPWREGLTVAEAVNMYGPSTGLIAVRMNGTHVPRGEYETTEVPDGAEIRIVEIIAGG